MRQHGHGRASCEHRQTECNRRDSEPRRDDWCGVPPPSVRWIGSRNMTATWAQNKNLATPLPDSSAAQGSFSLLQSKTRRREMRCLIFVTKEWIPRKYDKASSAKASRIIRFSAHAGTPHTQTHLCHRQEIRIKSKLRGLCACAPERGKRSRRSSSILRDAGRLYSFQGHARKAAPPLAKKTSADEIKPPHLDPGQTTKSQEVRPLARRNLEQEAGTPTLLAASRPPWPRKKWLAASLSHGWMRTTSEQRRRFRAACACWG